MKGCAVLRAASAVYVRLEGVRQLPPQWRPQKSAVERGRAASAVQQDLRRVALGLVGLALGLVGLAAVFAAVAVVR